VRLGISVPAGAGGLISARPPLPGHSRENVATKHDAGQDVPFAPEPFHFTLFTSPITEVSVSGEDVRRFLQFHHDSEILPGRRTEVRDTQNGHTTYAAAFVPDRENVVARTTRPPEHLQGGQ
jgi:hypothetical protein